MSNKNSMIEYESGVTPYLMEAITDSGDHKNYTTQADLFSELSGYAPDVRPDGIINGGNVSPAVSETDDAIDVETVLCYLAGVETTVVADTDVAITRPATDVSKVNSLMINSSGAFVVIPGTDGATTAFSATRGAAGGPPYIPVGSIEVAQVRVIESASSVITAAQIFATPGTHREMSRYPSFKIDNDNGKVIFANALPLSHTGDLTKGVYASYAEPVFTEQEYASDFIPADTAHSVASTETYSGVVGSSSSSIGQASFTAILYDGITDDILSKKNENIWLRFYQDKYKAAHILTQGILGISRTFVVSDKPAVACTISASRESVDRSS